MVSLLYHTGLRASELCGLRMEQCQGNYLVNVRRKGRAVTKRIYLQTVVRDALDQYLAEEGTGGSEWLFPSAKGGPVTPRQLHDILDKIAKEASKYRETPIVVHPHIFRHTFGTAVMGASGSESETAKLLGHSTTQHVGIYARSTNEERVDLLESISIQ